MLFLTCLGLRFQGSSLERLPSKILISLLQWNLFINNSNVCICVDRCYSQITRCAAILDLGAQTDTDTIRFHFCVWEAQHLVTHPISPHLCHSQGEFQFSTEDSCTGICWDFYRPQQLAPHRTLRTARLIIIVHFFFQALCKTFYWSCSRHSYPWNVSPVTHILERKSLKVG